MLEESKEKEVTQLQEVIQSKEKQLEKKAERLREIRQKSSEAEKEKSEELDKVTSSLNTLYFIYRKLKHSYFPYFH